MTEEDIQWLNSRRVNTGNKIPEVYSENQYVNNFNKITISSFQGITYNLK